MPAGILDKCGSTAKKNKPHGNSTSCVYTHDVE